MWKWSYFHCWIHWIYTLGFWPLTWVPFKALFSEFLLSSFWCGKWHGETCAAQQPRIDEGMWATISGKQRKTWVQVVSAYSNEEEILLKHKEKRFLSLLRRGRSRFHPAVLVFTPARRYVRSTNKMLRPIPWLATSYNKMVSTLKKENGWAETVRNVYGSLGCVLVLRFVFRRTHENAESSYFLNHHLTLSQTKKNISYWYDNYICRTWPCDEQP